MVRLSYFFITAGVALMAIPVVVTAASTVAALWPFVPLAVAIGATSKVMNKP